MRRSLGDRRRIGVLILNEGLTVGVSNVQALWYSPLSPVPTSALRGPCEPQGAFLPNMDGASGQTILRLGALGVKCRSFVLKYTETLTSSQ